MGEKIPHWLTKRASLSPQQTAIQYGNESVSFQELQSQSMGLARKMIRWGVRKGDHVAILSKNSLDMAICIHALTYIGAVGILLNIRLKEKEISFQLEDSEARFFVVDEIRYAPMKEVVQTNALQVTVHSYEELQEYQEADGPLVDEFDLDDLYTILYTSGTTGFPKGVRLTYGNHWWSAIASALNLGSNENDRWLAALPLFHVGGLSILIRSVVYGMSVHLHDRFNAETVHKEIMEKGVTTVSVVSVMLEQLLDKLNDTHYPETFRCMLLGGGPAPKALLEKAKHKEVPVFQTYGMTETSSQIVTLSPADALVKLGSAGKPLFPAQLRIMKDQMDASSNEVGEIIVKGPMVTKGYFKRSDANEQTIQNGWLYTGDVGYLDENGFLYVVDRRNDLIISGGENIYPAEVEGMLLGMDAVQEAGVIGQKDEKWGESPVAFVVLRDNEELLADDIINYCVEHLAKFKVPKEVYVVNKLPRNASNKLLRRELTEWLSERG